ncbi:MAG: DUF1707 domain-containing protein, partial [Gemmatimonadota bacterium]|nr:DUF1707 domain-containing protein [Gemmatimonadota bacterium]
MTGEHGEAGPPALSLRNRVIDSLTEQFASDGLTLEEFESRLDLAHRATSEEALQALLPQPLPTSQPIPGGRSTGIRRATADAVRPRSLAFGFWGGTQRSGSWIPARRNYAVAFQGGV